MNSVVPFHPPALKDFSQLSDGFSMLSKPQVMLDRWGIGPADLQNVVG